MKINETHRTATMDEPTEAYFLVALSADGDVAQVLDTFGNDPEDAKKALNRRDVARAADSYDSRYQGAQIEVLSGIHDCDAHAVPYVSDGALGHGWECGRCGSFLQAG